MYSTRKPEIIRHAAELFRTHSYDGTSIRDIGEAVGMEAASLYNHIKSKDQLLREICFWAANKYLDNLENTERRHISALDKLEDIIRTHIRMMIEEYDRAYVVEYEWSHLPEPHLSNFLNQRRTYRARLSTIIRQGIDAGDIKKIDPYVAVITFLAAIRGIENWHRSSKATTPQELEDNMVKYLVGGLKM